MSNDYRSIIKEGLWDQNVVFISMISFAATVFTVPITVAVPGSVANG